MPETSSAFPTDRDDERELLLEWLGFLRAAVVSKLDGTSEDDAHRRHEGRLLPLAGIVNHLTRVEWRWIDGAMQGSATTRSEDEFFPPSSLGADELRRAYRERADATDAFVRAGPLERRSVNGSNLSLRFIVLHLINETARHAGHADARRELLDDTTGE